MNNNLEYIYTDKKENTCKVVSKYYLIFLMLNPTSFLLQQENNAVYATSRWTSTAD
jgi:hypothetical protein